jgi:hypothetical protein
MLPFWAPQHPHMVKPLVFLRPLGVLAVEAVQAVWR